MANAKASAGQACNACPDGAFFIGTSADALSTVIGELSDLGPQLQAVLEAIRGNRGEPGGMADSLVCVASSRLSQVIEDLESLQIDLGRKAQSWGYSHE